MAFHFISYTLIATAVVRKGEKHTDEFLTHFVYSSIFIILIYIIHIIFVVQPGGEVKARHLPLSYGRVHSLGNYCASSSAHHSIDEEQDK